MFIINIPSSLPGSVVATENTGLNVVGMENEDSDGDGTVNGGVGYGEVIVKGLEARTLLSSKRLFVRSDTNCRSQP
ncbi:hypothetical protein Tco_0513464 [Tanacetum coccineum]